MEVDNFNQQANQDEAPKEPEEICFHLIQPEDPENVIDNDTEDQIFTFPFRQMFFRYSMFGKSALVKSTSIVYASHHPSISNWLQIKKLSVALVGNEKVPTLGLHSPTVTEVFFMGHISCPTTAFKMLTQLHTLKTVKFDFGLCGYVCEFRETDEHLRTPTPEIPGVTSLEIVMNHQLFHSSAENMKSVFARMVHAVLKHSMDSFPNLKTLTMDIPDTSEFLETTIALIVRNETLCEVCELKVDREQRRINVFNRPAPPKPNTLPFDPCARLPTPAEYEELERIKAKYFS